MGIGIPFENLSGTGRPLMLGINRRFVFEMTGIRIAVGIDSSGDQHPAVLSLLDPVRVNGPLVNGGDRTG